MNDVAHQPPTGICAALHTPTELLSLEFCNYPTTEEARTSAKQVEM